MKKFLKKIIPDFLLSRYHWKLAFLGALIYGFPSRRVFVLGVTGTKGKTTILEIVNAILEEAGYKTAIISTLRFKIGKESQPNQLKMTMPGRFFIQRFLKKAADAGCKYVLMEMTSQGVLQFRHKFIALDAMIYSNLASEHIEAHGSFGKYREAKLKIFKALENSGKKKKISIVNIDDENFEHFLRFKVDEQWIYGLKHENFEKIMTTENQKKLLPEKYGVGEKGIEFRVDGVDFHSSLLGEFNLYNILSAFAFARSQAVGDEIIHKALVKFSGVPGRVEFINEGQDFKVVVDYAHTPESLEKVYQLFQGSRRICVLGSAGGGRDKWKREKMGGIASAYCDYIVLTNEDPYDENPEKIVKDIVGGLVNLSRFKIIIDRREAIAEALKSAKTGDAVIITGKGTDPFIMGPGGTKMKWDDREVCREEIRKLLNK